MKFHNWTRRVLVVSAAALLVILFVRETRGGPPRRVSVPYDWSHRHVVFSQPSSIWQAWKLQKEPRYWQQMLRRKVAAHSQVNVPEINATQESALAEFSQRLKKSKNRFQRDWAESLGPGASTGNATYSQSPAKFVFDVTATSLSCSDYAVFTTNVPGVTGTSPAATGQASVIAFDHLYSGTTPTGVCGTAPTVAWAYNTNSSGDTTGVVNGSPVLSGDGTKIAFVESHSGGSVLHLLAFAGGDGTGPNGVETPTNLLTSGGWSACPADGTSCMISLTFTTGTVSSSSPYYHYSTDELFVGDDNGVLHKFTGVFNGTPTELTTGGWPVTLHPGSILNSPVLDAASGNVFVTDSLGFLSFVRDVTSNVGSCSAGSPPCFGSPSLQLAVGHPIVDPPVVDSSSGKVFTYVGNTGAGTATVVQTNQTLSGVVTLSMGPASGGAPLHIGAFNDNYLTSPAGSISASSFLYVCGKAGNDFPTLRQIDFKADGTMNSLRPGTLQVGNLTGAAGQCSPVTELVGGADGQDRVFFSVQSGGRRFIGSALTNCLAGGGCVMSANINAGFPSTLDSSQPEAGGTSAIIIDNEGSDSQESNIYFSRLGQSALSTCGGTGATLVGCAVKLTQTGFN
jgi:hypothetical protein